MTKPFVIPSTLGELQTLRASLVAELSAIEQQFNDPNTRNKFGTEEEYLSWKNSVRGAKLRSERRIAKVNARIKTLNIQEKGGEEDAEAGRVRKKARIERHMRRVRLLQGEYKIDPAGAHSLLHASWRMCVELKEKGVVFEEKENALIYHIEEFLVESCFLSSNGEIVQVALA